MLLETWNIYGSGFHFGRHGLGQEESGVHWPSDSLFAALVARLAALRGPHQVEAWIEPFLTDPPLFVLTSAFPAAGEIRFYPIPLRPASLDSTQGNVSYKKLKHVRYVSEKIFQKLISGVPLVRLFDEKLTLQAGQLLIDPADVLKIPESLRKSEKRTVWNVEQRPRVTVGRVQSSSNLYFTGRTSFAPDCGLWFGVQWFEEQQNARAELADLLQELGDAGLGGERNSGFGAARLEPSGQAELPDRGQGAWIALSRFLPDKAETGVLLDPSTAYSIETVGGWVQSPGKAAERRQSIHMLAEGSVLGPSRAAAPGRIVDVQPNYAGTQPIGHPVWRNGKTVAVGFNLTVAEGKPA